MVSIDGIHESLQKSLFSKYGKTVKLIKKSSPTYNGRGEVTGNTETESDITIVDYGIKTSSKQRMEWGVVQTGDRTAAIPYDITFSINDELEINSVRYTIVDIRQPELPTIVVSLVLLRKVTT